jgi:hypothetical protein
VTFPVYPRIFALRGVIDCLALYNIVQKRIKIESYISAIPNYLPTLAYSLEYHQGQAVVGVTMSGLSLRKHDYNEQPP